MSDLSTAIETFLGLPGLRGFWPLSQFDESGNAIDLSRHGKTLTYNGGGSGPTYNINPQGTGYLDFDATGDYLSTADASHFDILGTESYVASAANGLTMGGWFFADNASAEYTLMAKDDRSGQRSFRLYRSTISLVGAQIGSSGIASGTAVSGAWFFAALQFSGTSVRVYVNGTLSGAVSPLSITNTTAPFTIGGDGAGTQLLPGGAALCFLCAEFLTEAQLDQLYEDSWPLFNTFSTSTPAETVTLTETVSRNLVSLVKPATQAVTLTEAQTVRMTRVVSATETVTLTETVSRNLLDLVSQNETVTLTEAATVSMARPALASETITLTEGVTVNMVRSVSQNETVTLTEAQSVILAGLVSQAETITLSEAGTTVLLVSLATASETITLAEGVTVTLAAFGVSVAETVTLGEIVLVSTGNDLLISLSELITLSEVASAAPFEILTIVVYDTLALAETFSAPLFSIADTLGLTDSIIGTTIEDTLTLTDLVTIGNVTMVVEDTLTFSEVLELDGPTVPPPATPATGGLDTDTIVLRLIYGNDRRNPIRTLDLAQTAPGAIRLMAGGFAPGAGERTQLWSGESIRFDGQDLLEESLKNSELAITYALKTGGGSGKGSGAALSYFQRKVSRFFKEAKQHQTSGQNHTVWLEYRWSDGLNDLASPTFGQLSGYYEVLSATAPKWPDSLHNDIQDLSQGLIAGVVMEITGSPAPLGLKQRAATAGGSISLHDKGVLIASGASSRMHWPAYAATGLTGQFHITGWITLNATWGSGTKDVFDYYVSASNRIRIIYDAGNNRWTITKIVGGVTFTTNSSSDAVANGDDVHLQLVQDATTLYLYVDGILAASVAATATMTDAGLIALGCPGTGTIDGVDVILDGWRIMPAAITSTQALALYEAELPIKQDGGQVGPPPYWWTRDGDGQVDNADDTSRDNWGIIGGVGGDIEALTEIRVAPTINYASNAFWLGVKAQDSTFTPTSYIYFESTNEVVDANQSGGGYETKTGTSISFTSTKSSLATNLLFNRYSALVRIFATNGLTFNLTPGFNFATSGEATFWGRERSYTGIGKWQVVDLGDLFIEDDAAMLEESGSASLTFFLRLTALTSQTLRLDYAQLLPSPYVKVSSSGIPTITGAIPLIVENDQAYLYDLASNHLVEHMNYQGEALVATPAKYNYLFLAQSQVNDDTSISRTATLTIYITPRYLLPGGMVA